MQTRKLKAALILGLALSLVPAIAWPVAARLPGSLSVASDATRLAAASRAARAPQLTPIETQPTDVRDPDWIAAGGQADAWFGVSAAGAGDVNGDGYDDVIAGAPGYDGELADEGTALLYLGSAAGPASVPDWSARGRAVEAYFGQSVAGAGDVNGDGYDDLIVGAPWYTGPESAGGLALAFYGSPTGPGANADWTAEGMTHWALLGEAVAGAGDVNGDGYDDVIVGAPSFATTYAVGAVYVYHGSADGLAAVPDWSYVGSVYRGLLGVAVAGAGDVNSDGYGDVIVGSGLNERGAAHLFYGSADGLGAAPGWSVDGGQLDSYFGYAVGAAGDVDADGYDDVLVGARYYDGDHMDEGLVVLYRGAASGPSQVPAWRLEGGADWADVGNAVGGTGDVNGDGYDDLVVGGHDYSPTQADQWRAHLYLGAPQMDLALAWSGGGDGHSWYFGIAAGGAGDVNGDGHPDTLAGNPVHDASLADEGGAFLYLGGPLGQPIDGLAAWNNSPTALGSTTLLTATLTSGSDVSFTWSLGDGSSAVGLAVGHVYPAPGVFTATVTATNALGSATASTLVRVQDPLSGPQYVVYLPLLRHSEN